MKKLKAIGVIFLTALLALSSRAQVSTGTSPSVVVTSPTAGQVFDGTDPVTVTWIAYGYSGSFFVDLSDDGGLSWSTSYSAVTASGLGSYACQIRNGGGQVYSLVRASDSVSLYGGLLPSTRTQFRVRAASGGNNFSGVSPLFTVKPPTLTLLSPKGGEAYGLADVLKVKWSTTGFIGDVQIDLSGDSGVTWSTFGSFTKYANDGEESFDVSSYQAGGTTNIRLYGAGTTSEVAGFRPSARLRIRVRSSTTGGPYAVSSADFAIAATPPTVPGAARLVNLATRGFVGTGGNALFGGFVIRGGPQNVLIRAVGPSLSVFGLTGVLSDPKVDLFQGSTVVATNDNWGSGDAAAIAAATASVGGFALPAGSKDAVLLIKSLPEGSYTPVVTGADGGAGIAIVEVYELP
jgi:hypothetical protein